jgi:LytS/YehU family sensor histidine kinase
MLIQLFVENAIKHGLFYKKEDGIVTVEVAQQPEAIKIMIQDNGVGRAEVTRLGEKRKGKGMLILKNYLRLFKEQYNRDITFEIQDITQEKKVCGTKVEILIWV